MRSNGPSTWLRTLGLVLFVIGLALLILGIVYYAIPANRLPSFLGHIANSTKHHTRRGLVAVVGGTVCWLGAAFAFLRSRAR